MLYLVSQLIMYIHFDKINNYKMYVINIWCKVYILRYFIFEKNSKDLNLLIFF